MEGKKGSLLWDDDAWEAHQSDQQAKNNRRKEVKRRQNRRATPEQMKYVSASDAKRPGRLNTDKAKLPNSVLEEMALREQWAKEAREILAYEKKQARLKEERELAELIYEEGSGLRPSDRASPIKEDKE